MSRSVIKRPRGTALLHVLHFPVPFTGVIAPVVAFFSPLIPKWGPVVGVVLVAYVVALYFRSRSVRLEIGGSDLRVVNMAHTVTLPSADISAIEWGRIGIFSAGGSRGIYVVTTRGDRVPIQASVSLFVRKLPDGTIESKFDDSVLRDWARKNSIRFLSENEAFTRRKAAAARNGKQRK